MKKFWRIALISTAVSAVIYFGAALILTFWPAQPTFAVEPFPVARHSAAEFTSQQYTMRDGEILFARRFPADSDDTILLLHFEPDFKQPIAIKPEERSGCHALQMP